MSADEELKQKVLEWVNKNSKEGIKTKFYLKDVVKGLAPDYAKKDVHKAVNELIEEDKLMWFSTGSTSMVTLPEFHKG